MKMLVKILAVAMVASFLMMGSAAAEMFNGHDYIVVKFPDQTWHAAQDQIVTTLGNDYYLATITSREEQLFVQSLIISSLSANDPGWKEYWIGGFQSLNETVPDQGWNWITGEKWDYTNWASQYNEPRDYYGPASEQYLTIWGEVGWQWNDEGHISYISGYVAESSTPEPATLFLLGFGLIGITGLRRKSKRQSQN